MSLQPISSSADAWIRPLAPRPQARLRLICFHPAGAGAYLYRSWAKLLPADVELLAVQLPGREGRLGEPCLTDYREAVAQTHAVLRPRLDRPYAFFGHSMGAMLAYGVTRAVAEHGDRLPGRLLVSGCPGPGSSSRKPGREAWSDDELVEDLREMGGTPEEVLTQPDLLELILPTLRADFAICAGYHAEPPTGPALNIPVSVLAGLDDTVAAADLDRWSATTSAGSSVRMFSGGHFFLTGESQDQVLAAVTSDLAATPG
ncbi:medium-chain acyl-[acyl-carrier-protein] hydrolase [Kitasatospora sp. GAS204A]|uniref:thioesterase II family protein n=1 Tax=unclassified Kitasatospora TaxID=2633591 RepID=UPI002474EFEA|nr:alpha/beta fold hydrolase [Kitasatospora sp. GAS204B]MDH6121017.1 medium-chain acyl-[acyl-carrier-protein] hydrolase [Kitasatospora sp. GAS204B]